MTKLQEEMNRVEEEGGSFDDFDDDLSNAKKPEK